MRSLLCVLALAMSVPLWSQSKPIEEAPVRRVVIYKDGHCLTEREVIVDPTENPVQIVNSLNALLGGVWAVSRHKTIALKGLSTRILDETRTVAPSNLAELLLLNDGKRVSLTLMFPAPGEEHKPVQIETYEGILRAFKPSLRYEDAYPTEDTPPEYFPTPMPRPSRRDWYYWQWQNTQKPVDYVQDLFSRTASQANFALETSAGMVFFTPPQIKQIEFLEPAVRERTITVKRPVLELTLSEGRRGEKVPVSIYSLEKGIRWYPEYQLNLSSPRASEGELILGATIINELADLKDADAALALGFIQFLMHDQPSPLSLRDEFRRLSNWFETEPNDSWRYFYGAPRVSDFVGAGGFGGFAAPSTPGMGLETLGIPVPANDSIAFLSTPKLTLPRNSSTRVELSRQKLAIDHTFLWMHDISGSQQTGFYSYNQRSGQPLTIDEIAYRIARERRFSGEVYEAIILKNTQNTPWTTAPILVTRNGMPVTQDVLLFTPPGEEAFIYITPATKVRVACTFKEEPDNSSGFRSSWVRRWRGVVQFQNDYDTPVRLMVRLRFLGRFEEASRKPTRILVKSTERSAQQGWYSPDRLPENPTTELIWDVEVPPGSGEWSFLYTRSGN